MSSIKKKMLGAVSIVVIVSAFVLPVGAAALDESNWATKATFKMPVQIGDLVLVPGTYELQLTKGTVDRDVMAIYSIDQKRWVGMVMGINDERIDTSKMSGFTFEDLESGAPRALEYWFYSDWHRGIKFLYPQTRKAESMAAAIVPAAR